MGNRLTCCFHPGDKVKTKVFTIIKAIHHSPKHTCFNGTKRKNGKQLIHRLCDKSLLDEIDKERTITPRFFVCFLFFCLFVFVCTCLNK